MIDWNLFRSKLEPYPKELVLEVINTFLSTYPQDRIHLKAAIDVRNWPDIERHAHDVKTNCLWVGATDAADLALQIEMKGKKFDGEELASLFPLMDKAVEEVLSELTEYSKSL